MRQILKILLILLICNLNAISQWKEIVNLPVGYDDNMWLDVYFLTSNPDYGWVCGFNGLILRTTDAGNNWLGTRVNIARIDSTIRFGKTFYDTTYGKNADQLESIHFASEKIGYTSGEDKVFKSTDGGITWNMVSDTSIRAWGVFFITEDIGLSTGGGCENDFQQFNRTTDGGKTWTKFLGNTKKSGLTDALLYSPDGLGYASSSGFIWKTTDGGINWFTFSKTGNNDWQEEITNFGNSFLVPYSLGCSGDGNDDGGLRMSTDNGIKWREYNTGDDMFGAFLMDSLRGWGCGSNGAVYYTSDGGAHWELKNCGIDPSLSMDDLWFINDTLGWVVGKGLFKTHKYDTVKAQILNDKPLGLCNGDSVKLESKTEYLHYRWSTGDTSKSIYVNQQGVYKLETFNENCDFKISDSVNIDFFPKTDVKILSDKTPEICEGDSVFLWVQNKHKGIKWSTSETTDTIKVKVAGRYFVTIIDSNSCDYSQVIDVIVNPLPEPKITEKGKLHFCEGDSVILSTTKKYNKYSWFENSNPDRIITNLSSMTVREPGGYSVIVANEFGCIDTSGIANVEVWFISNLLRISSVDQNEYIDFDSVNISAIKCENLKIENYASYPVTVNNIYIKGNTIFSIPQVQLPLIIDAASYSNIEVCFRPLNPTVCRDTIIIEDTCSAHYIHLLGTGAKNYYEAESDCNVGLNFSTHSTINDSYFDLSTPWPNPTDGNFQINISLADLKEIPQINSCLYNSYGEEIKISQTEVKIKQNGNNSFLNIKFNSGFIPNGLYYLKIGFSNRIIGMALMIYK